ncbi:MAG: hypothetical protein HC875_16195 [Anaerolineales bacterium]|nr:hypothetical protein [Anaerolineales bacterium]
MDVTISAPPRQTTENGVTLWLRLLAIWHAVVSVAGLAGGFAVWQMAPEMATWQRILVTVILILTALASGGAVPFIMQREHRGRMLSLVVNYLWFWSAFLGRCMCWGYLPASTPWRIPLATAYLIC